VLLRVTVCAALEEPTMTAGKVSFAGLTLSPEVTWAAPFRGTEIGVTPAVAEETINVAELAPAAMGEKMTWTVQLPPALKDAGQVVIPVAKLPAEAPVI